jgi:hypothetical protein
MCHHVSILASLPGEARKTEMAVVGREAMTVSATSDASSSL